MTAIRINLRLWCIYCTCSIRDMKINLYSLNSKSDFPSFVGSTSTQSTMQSTVTDSTTTTTKNIISTGKNIHHTRKTRIHIANGEVTVEYFKMLTFHFAR